MMVFPGDAVWSMWLAISANKLTPATPLNFDHIVLALAEIMDEIIGLDCAGCNAPRGGLKIKKRGYPLTSVLAVSGQSNWRQPVAGYSAGRDIAGRNRVVHHGDQVRHRGDRPNQANRDNAGDYPCEHAH